jgi:arginyl-tRNA synthetase
LKFTEFEEEVSHLVADACENLHYDTSEIEVTLPPNEAYGDLSTAVPLRIGKQTGEKPGDVALKLADVIMKQTHHSRYVGGVSAHQGGYLNFTLKHDRFAFDSISEALSGEVIGASRPEKEVVAIEHTNVNPNKALHIGHARNLVLGDSLARVMKHLGYRTQVLNYIDDSGAQVADVIVGFKFLGIPQTPPEGMKFDVYCGDKVYTKVNQEYLANTSLKEKQSQVLREIEKGDGEIALYTKSIVGKILSAQLSTCWRLGATYDLLNWESQLVHSGMWERIFETMKKNGDVRFETQGDNKGCWVIPDPETGEQKVVVRSDGTLVYVAKDIPYAAWKLGIVDDPFGYEVYNESQPGGGTLYSTSLQGGKSGKSFGKANLAISVIDTRQSYLQRIVAKVLERLRQGSASSYLHRSYEVVALSKKTAQQTGFQIRGDFAHMAGRKGLYVNADTVLDSLKAKAKVETRKRNLSEKEDWCDDVSEALAVAALRYELLKQDPDKMIIFDMEESLRFDGDTGPYLMYTYARAKRILDKTEGKPRIDMVNASKLTRKQEKELVKRMSMLDMAVIKAGEYLSPKEVALYAHELAVRFNEFYEKVPVNKEEDAGLRDARLALVEASSRVLAQAMRLIGIPVRSRI